MLLTRLVEGQIATVLQLPHGAVRATEAAEPDTMRAQGAPAAARESMVAARVLAVRAMASIISAALDFTPERRETVVTPKPHLDSPAK